MGEKLGTNRGRRETRRDRETEIQRQGHKEALSVLGRDQERHRKIKASCTADGHVASKRNYITYPRTQQFDSQECTQGNKSSVQQKTHTQVFTAASLIIKLETSWMTIGKNTEKYRAEVARGGILYSTKKGVDN